jgi:hypothetical protein
MTTSETPNFTALIGKWEGETKTIFDPSAGHEAGHTKTEFKFILDNLFLEETYEGSIGSKTHNGRRILGFDSRLNAITCCWMDTFHTGATAMARSGPIDPSKISVLGHYYGGSDKWGWRTDFVLKDDELTIQQFNISPSGQVDLAVESKLRRRTA